jgi:Cu-processing system ATP-binding protein
MIRIENISKNFTKQMVLSNVNLEFQTNECIALIGPNGCGKTTLIKSILGMVLPQKGNIFFEGVDIRKNDLYRKKIGYMPQIGRYPENMTVGQLIDMIKGIRNSREQIDLELYEQYNIPQLLPKKMRTLSGGTTQKISAFIAFMFQPKVLILDEPTAGLDPIAAEILKQKINHVKQEGRLVLITSHLLSELEDMVSQIVFMQEGKVLLHKNTEELKIATQQTSVAKSILHLLKTNQL